MALCRERVHESSRILGSNPFRVEVEIHFFLVALLRFYKAVYLGTRYLSGHSELQERVKHFNTYIGIKKTMRNVGEHFDEYLEGDGHDRAIDSRDLQVWSLDTNDGNVRFKWIGETFDLEKTMNESLSLWTIFKTAYVERANRTAKRT